MSTERHDSPLKVFISYSRRDLAFADWLVAALKQRGFEVLIDRQDLPKLEDWERELLAFIQQADTVVFVVSPHSLASKVVSWEVEQVRLHAKRLAPVVIAAVEEGVVPREIARINHIFFLDRARFEESADELARALNTDIAWLKEHTRLGELARRWIERSRPEDALVRGRDVDDADAWAAQRPREAPIVSPAHLEFLAASRAAQTERLEREQQQVARTRRFQRRAVWALAGVAFLLAIGLVAGLLQSRSTSQREARVLTSLAAAEIAKENYDRAMRIAVHGLPAPGDPPWISPWSRELEAKLMGSAWASRLIAQLDGQANRLVHAHFSHDGTLLLTTGADNSLLLWNGLTGARVATLGRHRDAASGARFSPDDKFILTPARGNSAQLWNVQSKSIATILSGHDGEILDAVFNAAGDRALTASFDNTARIWNTRTGAPLVVLRGHEGLFVNVSFSPDGTRVLTSSRDETARLWDTESGRAIAVFRGDSGPEHGVFSPDGNRIVTFSQAEAARLWDGRTGAPVATLGGHGDSLTLALFSPDGSRLVTLAREPGVGLWDGRTGEKIATLDNGQRPSRATFSNDGTRLLVDAGNAVRVWDARTGAASATLRGHQGGISSLAFTSDGSLALTASSDTTARLWDAQRGTEIALLKGHGYSLEFASFSPDNSRVVTMDRAGVLRLWDARPRLHAHYVEGVNLQYTPDGKRIVLWPANGTSAVLDSANGRKVAELQEVDPAIRQIIFSHDSRSVALFDDGILQLWSVEGGKPKITLRDRSGRRPFSVRPAIGCSGTSATP